MAEEKKDNNGCAKIGFIIILLTLWGIMGMVHGESFLGGIGESIRALVILIVVGAVGYGILKAFKKL